MPRATALAAVAMLERPLRAGSRSARTVDARAGALPHSGRHEWRNMTTGPALEAIVVTELGGREAVGVCGMLLAQLGATVVVVEPTGLQRPRDACRAQLTAGKQSLACDLRLEQDRSLLARLVARSDVLLTSSDIDPPELRRSAGVPAGIVCDITAFGATGPRAGEAFSELQLQALTGIADTTGLADGPPLPIGVPILGYVSGVHATAAVLAALRVQRRQGFGQGIEIAMFDAGFAALHAYLAGLKSGTGTRTRLGNRHPTTPAWNLFPTADGHVLICAGSQSQWVKLCKVMQRPDVAAEFETAAARMRAIETVEAAIEQWTRTLPTDECVRQLVAAGVAAGPIAPIDRCPREANLEFRGMIRELRDPVTGRNVFVPASPLGLRGSPAVSPAAIPARGGDRELVERLASRPAAARPAAAPSGSRERPLAGVRVIEVGQYTTAPLCARYLAHLGADVIKIEKPGGDESRTFGERHGDRSDTYCLSNADKRSVVLDLQDPQGMEVLKSLLRSADVLVENNKPGTLARFGLDADVLAGLNPRLVVCAISGFGAESLYGDRPGFDTVIQAMSGFMSAVNPGGLPLKSGISSSDVMGSLTGIVAILAALEYRDRTGQGQFIDLSMQDVSCWATAPVWNTDLAAIGRPSLVRCADGFVLVEASEADLAEALQQGRTSREQLAARSRAEVDRQLAELALRTAPVHTVSEACELPQTRARGMWFTLPAEGRDWPMVGTPLRLQLTPPVISRHGSSLDADGPAIRGALGYASTRAEGA
jgi:crotonobetainyl-CoA:carnitine CoA-transferase CaiB-like acyl-CoA transferase